MVEQGGQEAALGQHHRGAVDRDLVVVEVDVQWGIVEGEHVCALWARWPWDSAPSTPRRIRLWKTVTPGNRSGAVLCVNQLAITTTRRTRATLFPWRWQMSASNGSALSSTAGLPVRLSTNDCGRS